MIAMAHRFLLLGVFMLTPAVSRAQPDALLDETSEGPGFDANRDTPTHSNGFGVRWRSSLHYSASREGEFYQQMGGFCMGTSSLCQHIFELHRRDAPQSTEEPGERLRARCATAAGREEAMLQAGALQTQLPRPEIDYFVRPATAGDFVRNLRREIRERGTAVITYVFVTQEAGDPPRNPIRDGWFEAMGHSVVAYQMVELPEATPAIGKQTGIRIWDPNFERGFPWSGGNGELIFDTGTNTLAFAPRYRSLSSRSGPPGSRLQSGSSLAVGREIWLTVVPRKDRLSALERIGTSGLQVTDSGPPGLQR